MNRVDIAGIVHVVHDTGEVPVVVQDPGRVLEAAKVPKVPKVAIALKDTTN